MLKIGHRGAMGYEPENTLIGFQKALDLNVDQIELDVQLTADKVLVVVHDETVDRTTNGKGLVHTHSLRELQAYKIKNQQYLPAFTEVLNLVDKRCSINIEIKSEGVTEILVPLLEEQIADKGWNYNHFIISSFNWSWLEQIYHLNSEFKIAVLTDDEINTAIAFANSIECKTINPHYSLLTSEITAAMQAQGFQVFPWTVNDNEVIARLKSYGVDGIISDYPDRLH
jgi:glycerophosphoryl diester phosphodiesterase